MIDAVMSSVTAMVYHCLEDAERWELELQNFHREFDEVQ